MTIRHAKHTDVKAIGELWIEFMDFHEGYDSFYRRARNGETAFRDFIDEQISSKSALVLVATDDSAVNAYLLARIESRPPVFEKRRLGSIYDLAVSKHWRRQGIGESLYKESVLWFKKRKIDRIELTIATSNPLAASFWEKHGFMPYHERRFLDIGS